jgi:arylsulfatase A-like enzyme
MLTKTRLLLLPVLAALLTASPGLLPDPTPPNVLMIAVDDMNDFIGALGHPDAITPNLDRLIRRGAVFSNAHCQSPLCGPSRAALMTGLRPSTTGIYGMIDDDLISRTNEATRRTPLMYQYFRDRGYHTMGVGKLFHEHAPEGLLHESGGRQKGFGPSPKEPFHWKKKGTSSDWGAFPERDEQMPDYHSARWAIERLGRSYDTPFFLSVGFLRPHVPWYVPKKWFDLYDPGKLHLPPYLSTDREDLPGIARQIDDLPMMPTTDWAIESKQWRNILQGYLASVSFADHYIGQVLDALEKSPHAKNTVVVLWSDHGYRLGEKGTFAKVCLWDRATRAPLIFAGPGIPENANVPVPVELFSVYPTLAELCGLGVPSGVEARSLRPLLVNPREKWPYPALTTWGRNNHAVKTSAYRYIRYEDGAEELYALKTDPNEWHNVAGQKKYIKVKEQLRKYLPTSNVLWAAASQYDNNAYFIRQKKEQSEPIPTK